MRFFLQTSFTAMSDLPWTSGHEEPDLPGSCPGRWVDCFFDFTQALECVHRLRRSSQRWVDRSLDFTQKPLCATLFAASFSDLLEEKLEFHRRRLHEAHETVGGDVRQRREASQRCFETRGEVPICFGHDVQKSPRTIRVRKK